MKSDEPRFTEAEKNALRNRTGIVAERHKVSVSYVQGIINEGRAIKSVRAKAIFADLKETASFINRPLQAPPPPPGTKPRTAKRPKTTSSLIPKS